MKQKAALKILVLGNILMALLLTACGSSPPARFYALTPMPLQISADKTILHDKNRIIAIGPIEIPEYLDRAEIVTRVQENQLMISEFDLWGGSIKTDISRVLVENIGSLLDRDGLAVVAWKTTMTESYRVPVILYRFDVVQDGSLTLRAQWAVFDKDGKNLLSFQEAIITKPAKGGGYDVLVALMSEALGDLSKTIAENLRFIKNNFGH